MANWIRPKQATQPIINQASGVASASGLNYFVVTATVNAVPYSQAAPIDCPVTPQVTKGPFQVGPACVGKLIRADANSIEAEWYFEKF